MADDEGERTAAARAETGLVLLVVAGVVVLYGLRGGTYDVVPRGASAIVIWWALALGFAAGRLPRARLSWPSRAVAAGFALLVGWTLLAFGWTDSDERTSVELARTAHHAGVFVLAVCVLSRRTLPAALAGLAVGTVVVTGVSVASRLWPAAFEISGSIRDYAGNRLQYPLDYWNAVGGMGATAAALALAWSAHARAAAWRCVALAAVPLSVVAVYLTYSRSSAFVLGLGAVVVVVFARTRAVAVLHTLAAAGASYLAIRAVRANEAIAQGTGSAGRDDVLAALAVGAVICVLVALGLALLQADRRLRLPQRRHARVAEAVALVVIVIVGAIVLPPVVERGWEQFTDQIVATPPDEADPASRLGSLGGARADQYESALRAYRSDTFNGIGPGTFEFWWNRDVRNSSHIRDVHSLYLEMLAELGWPGLLFTLLVCGGALAGLAVARARARDATEAGAIVGALAAFAIWLVQAGVDWMWEETVLAVVALLAAGAACAALGGPFRPPRVALRVAVPVVALLAVAVQISPTVGTSRVRDSQQAIRREDPQQALEAATDAVEAWPWAATPYVQRALVFEATGDLEAARADLQRAIAREPVHWRPLLLLARIEARRGRTRAALAAFRRARDLRPGSGVFAGDP